MNLPASKGLVFIPSKPKIFISVSADVCSKRKKSFLNINFLCVFVQYKPNIFLLLCSKKYLYF